MILIEHIYFYIFISVSIYAFYSALTLFYFNRFKYSYYYDLGMLKGIIKAFETSTNFTAGFIED
jgi:hypothetical protein